MKYVSITISALVVLLGTASGALAQSTICTAPITKGPIFGDVVVPNGANCLLGYDPPPSNPCCESASPGTAVVVTGSVTVGTGASLTVGLNSIIIGSIVASNCNYVELVSEGSEYVGGNVTISNCAGQIAFLTVGTGSVIGGSLSCSNNTGPCIIEDAYVGGSVTVDSNVSPAGSPSQVYFNTISGNLQCTGNGSSVPIGSNNNVAGNKTGQCVGF